MRRFLADVSHEIRTPLTALKGYSDLYERGMLAEPGALDRAMVPRRQRERQAPPPGELHDGAGPRRRDAVPTSSRTSTCLRSCARWSTTCARRTRSVGSTPTSCPGSGAPLAGDPDRIHQAILNLGANACTHTPSLDPDHDRRGDAAGCRRDQRDRPRSRDRRSRAGADLPALLPGRLVPSPTRPGWSRPRAGRHPTDRPRAPRIDHGQPDPGRRVNLHSPPSPRPSGGRHVSHDPWLVVASDGSAAISSSTEKPRVLAAASKSGGGPPSADSSLATDTPSVFAASVRSGEAPAGSAPAAAAGGAPASPSPAGGAPASPLTSPEVEATSFPEVVESLGEVSAPQALNIRAAASESATRDFFGQAVEFMSLTVMDQSVRLRWGGWEARVMSTMSECPRRSEGFVRVINRRWGVRCHPRVALLHRVRSLPLRSSHR